MLARSAEPASTADAVARNRARVEELEAQVLALNGQLQSLTAKAASALAAFSNVRRLLRALPRPPRASPELRPS